MFLSRVQEILREKQFLFFALVFCFIFVWRCWFLSQEIQTRYLQITGNTSGSGTVQLYYDQGYGFNEHDSVVALPMHKKPNGNSNQSYQFQLTPSVINAMRFVFEENCAGVQLQEIDVLDGLGLNLQTLDLASLIIGLGGEGRQIDVLFDPSLQLGITRPVLKLGFVTKVLTEGCTLGFVMTLLFLLYQSKWCSGGAWPIFNQTTNYLKKPANQETIIFLALTVLFLWAYRPLSEQWFPLLFGKALFCCFVILVVRFFLYTDIQQRAMNLFYFGISFYLLLIVTSTTFHYFAANQIVEGNFISIFQSNFHGILFQKDEGVKRLVDQSSAFMYFFPVMILVAISFFRLSECSWKKLVWIPVIFVPCVVVALYQVYIDRDFLNRRPLDDFMGGLSSSLIGLRFILFLLFPLFVFVVLITKRWWSKIVFLMLSSSILWLSYLGGGRAAILGILIFVIVLPFIWCWVRRGRTKINVREYIYVSVFLVLGLSVVVGFWTPKYHDLMSKVFTRDVVISVNAILKGDFTNRNVSTRAEMSRQSWKLIKDAPVSGWGPAAFMKNVNRVRLANGDQPGAYQAMTNLYLQAWGNFGIIGLGAMLFLHIMPIWMVFRIRKQIRSMEERWAVGIVVTTVLITLLLFNTNPNIDYPDANWVYCLYLGFLVSVALKYGYVLHLRRRWALSMGGLVIFVVFIGGTYRTTFGSHGYEAIQKELLAAITSGYQQDDSITIWDSEQMIEGRSVSNTLIKTRGNPFRVKYVNNVFRMQATTNPFELQMNGDLFCVRTSVVTIGNHGSFILGVRVFVNDKPIDKYNFHIEGKKMLFYKLPESNGENAEIKVEIDLRKSIPYHQDYRTEITQDYMPHHTDYKDLRIIVDVIPFTSR